MAKFLASLVHGLDSTEVSNAIKDVSSQVVITNIHERPQSSCVGALILFECTEEVFKMVKDKNISGIKYLGPEILYEIPEKPLAIRRD